MPEPENPRDWRLYAVFGGSALLAVGFAAGLWIFPRTPAPPTVTVSAHAVPDPADLSTCEGWARLSITRPATYQRETWHRAGLDGSTGSAHIVTVQFWSDSALGNRTRRKAVCRFEGGLAPDGARPWLADFQLDGKVPRAFRETMEAAQ